MLKERFLELLDEPGKISLKDLPELRSIFSRWPYFQCAHALFAYGNYSLNTKDHEEVLQHTMIYFSKEEYFNEFLSQPVLSKQETEEINQLLETKSDGTLSKNKTTTFDKPLILKTEKPVKPTVSYQKSVANIALFNEISRNIASLHRNKKSASSFLSNYKVPVPKPSKPSSKTETEKSKIVSTKPLTPKLKFEQEYLHQKKDEPKTTPASIKVKKETQTFQKEVKPEKPITTHTETLTPKQKFEQEYMQKQKEKTSLLTTEKENKQDSVDKKAAFLKSIKEKIANKNLTQYHEVTNKESNPVSEVKESKSEKVAPLKTIPSEGKKEADIVDLTTKEKNQPTTPKSKKLPSQIKTKEEATIKKPISKEEENDIVLSYLESLKNKKTDLALSKKKTTITVKKNEVVNQKELIDAFIKKDEELGPIRANNSDNNEPTSDLSQLSSLENSGLVSENLALINVKQGKFEKAIKIYQQLILKNPAKKAYFAGRIQELKNS